MDKRENKKIFKKINKKKGISSTKAAVLELLHMQEELDLKYSKITFIDNKKMMIEGKNNVIDYYENYIKFLVENIYVIVEGKLLNITDISEDELIISGRIENVQYKNKE